MTWDRIKIAGEVIVFLIYVGTGMMAGWIQAPRESSLGKLISTLSMSVAFLLLWGLHRWRNVFFWKIQTTVDGAITGAVIGAAQGVTNFAIQRTILNVYVDWLILIGAGILAGGVYGWLNQRRNQESGTAC